MLALLWLGACISPAPGSLPVDPLDGPPPAITQVTWACDAEASRWDFSIVADAWTGGGTIWVARDAEVYEAHRIRSVEAKANGTQDTLELSLGIVADWRDASSGSSTQWRCTDAPSLSFQAAVYDTPGDAITDCRAWGAAPELWADVLDSAACDTLLEVTDTGVGVR